jgi:hypothetical protein
MEKKELAYFSPVCNRVEIQSRDKIEIEESEDKNNEKMAFLDFFPVQHLQKELQEETYEIEQDLSPSQELLMWHTKLAHISQKRLQLMAGRGQLPKRLSKCQRLKCQACEFGKATKRPW